MTVCQVAPHTELAEPLRRHIAGLTRHQFTAKSVTPMRSYVHEPKLHGNLFLAGDAAHIVPPIGAKGLNLAVGDVVTFARAFVHFRESGDPARLDSYSQTCLRRVWQAEPFSYAMTTMLHRAPGATPFDDRIQLGPPGPDRCLPRGRGRPRGELHRIPVRLTRPAAVNGAPADGPDQGGNWPCATSYPQAWVPRSEELSSGVPCGGNTGSGKGWE